MAAWRFPLEQRTAAILSPECSQDIKLDFKDEWPDASCKSIKNLSDLSAMKYTKEVH